MSELDLDAVKALTQLSRIECSPEEELQLLEHLDKVLDCMKLLKNIPTDDVPPCYSVLEFTENVTREDEVKEPYPRDDFIANSPSHVGGMIRIPTVIQAN